LSTAIEFQEVQGFFVIAIQIATLATFRYACGASCPVLDSVESVGEILMTSELVRTLAINSILPVLLQQALLQSVGMRWWYSLTITTTLFFLAVAIQDGNLFPPVQSLWEHLKVAEPILECGGNPSPKIYCLAGLPQVGNGVPFIPGLRIAYVAMPFLILDQLAHSKPLRGYFEKMPKSAIVQDLAFRGIFRFVYHIVWIGLQLGLLVNVIVYLRDLLGITSGIGMDPTQWTYGQLVAVMLWAPIVGKYIYYNVCKCLCILSIQSTRLRFCLTGGVPSRYQGGF
jgi:hypothetical protein